MRRLIYILTSLCVILCLFLLGASEFAIQHALNPGRRQMVVAERLHAVATDYPWTAAWVDSLQAADAIRDTFIVNHRGDSLHAFYVEAPEPTPNTAILVHGYTDCSLRMLCIGYLYHYNLGFNILLPDLYYHGFSQGDYIQMGWLDRLDVMQWMEVANHRFGGATRQVVHGISMGGATTMMVSGESLPDYVRAFVDDCGYTSVWDEFQGELRNQFGLPPFPVLYTSSLLCRMQLGWSFQEASALHAVERCHLPMLFIHGGNDTYVPTEMVYRLHAAKPQPKALWVAPGSAHACSYGDWPSEYTRQVATFLSGYFDDLQVRETSSFDRESD